MGLPGTSLAPDTWDMCPTSLSSAQDPEGCCACLQFNLQYSPLYSTSTSTPHVHFMCWSLCGAQHTQCYLAGPPWISCGGSDQDGVCAKSFSLPLPHSFAHICYRQQEWGWMLIDILLRQVLLHHMTATPMLAHIPLQYFSWCSACWDETRNQE